MLVRMATGEQVGARPVGWGDTVEHRERCRPSGGSLWAETGGLRAPCWGGHWLLGLSHLPLQRQQERRRQRARKQELLPAEVPGKHPLQNRYGRPGLGQSLPALGAVCWGWRGTLAWLSPLFPLPPQMGTVVFQE